MGNFTCCVKTGFIPLENFSTLIPPYGLTWVYDNFQVVTLKLCSSHLGIKCCLANDLVFRNIPESHDKYTFAILQYVNRAEIECS